MLEISEKILKILLDNEISPEDISEKLNIVQSDIQLKLWEKITISPMILYMLKDTVFYNFEYLYHSNNPTGLASLRYFGSEYPTIMNIFTSSPYILKEDLPNLLKELQSISEKWSENVFLANLSSKYDFDWRFGEENPSKLIIYNKDIETPAKYGYYSFVNNQYSKIYGKDNQPISKQEEIVLCSIQKIDMFREYNVLTRFIENLLNTTKKAINNDKGLLGDFENYNYEN